MIVSLSNAKPTVTLVLTYDEALYLKEMCDRASVQTPSQDASQKLQDVATNLWGTFYRAGVK